MTIAKVLYANGRKIEESFRSSQVSRIYNDGISKTLNARMKLLLDILRRQQKVNKLLITA